MRSQDCISLHEASRGVVVRDGLVGVWQVVVGRWGTATVAIGMHMFLLLLHILHVPCGVPSGCALTVSVCRLDNALQQAACFCNVFAPRRLCASSGQSHSAVAWGA
jgi:hypothetical protein